ADAVLHRLLRRVLGGELRGKRRRLARALEPARAGARPRDDVSADVCDRHDRVVERRRDVRDAGLDVLPDLLLLLGRSCHRCLLLRHGAELLDRHATRALARAGVGMRALTAHREIATMTTTAIRAEVDETLDAELDIAPEVTLDAILVALDRIADLADVGLVE